MQKNRKDSILISSYARYSIAVLIGAIAILSSSAFLVWVSDPFKRLATSDHDKAFCNKLALGGTTAWFLKSIIFREQKYDAIIVGSSKILYIDPSLYKYYRFVNGGVGGTTPESMFELLDAFASEINVVVLALDFYMFNEARFPYATDEQIAEVRAHFRDVPTLNEKSYSYIKNLVRTSVKNLPYLLSLNAAAEAVQQVGKSKILGKRFLMPRGNLDISDWTNEMSKREKAGTRHIERALYDSQMKVLRTDHYTPYVFSERRIEVLKKIRDLMAKRGITLIVQMNPVHAEDKQLIDSLRITADFERYRSIVREVFPDAADFSGSMYADPKYFFDWDPIHFLPSTGAMLVNQELEKIASEEARRKYESNPTPEASSGGPDIYCE